MLNHCEYVLFLDYGSLICDTDQEVSAFHGHVSPSAALQKPCLPPVQENKILCNQDEKPCFLYSEYERGTDQKVPALEAPDEFAKVHMQTFSRPLTSWVGPWKLYVIM